MSILGADPGVDIAHHVQVVMVDVDHFHRVFVGQRMRHRPADPMFVSLKYTVHL